MLGEMYFGECFRSERRDRIVLRHILSAFYGRDRSRDDISIGNRHVLGHVWGMFHIGEAGSDPS